MTQNLEPILIISYYFPPCNLTPSERIYSWAKYLGDFGFYPIVITRNWDIEIKSPSDELKSSGNEIKVEYGVNYEVHYLPYKQSLKEKYYTKNGLINKLIYNLLSIITNLQQTITFMNSPMVSFYKYARDVISGNKQIRQVIVSAYPYSLFEYAFNLKKEFTHINWIADYRDDWTSNEILNKSLFHKFTNQLNKRNEIKWLSNAKCYTTVSDYYVTKIQKVLKNKIGDTIYNGFMPENYQTIKEVDNFDIFTITYVGSLYHTQPIEIFCDAVLKFLKNNENPKIQFVFVGLRNNTEAINRITSRVADKLNYFVFTQRLPKAEAIEIQAKSHFLLICNHTNMKGTPGSKLYEYIALQKPVLVFPGDQDIVEETLSTTGQLVLAKHEDELVKIITNNYYRFLQGQNVEITLNASELNKFNRKYQTEKLAKLLKS